MRDSSSQMRTELQTMQALVAATTEQLKAQASEDLQRLDGVVAAERDERVKALAEKCAEWEAALKKESEDRLAAGAQEKESREAAAAGLSQRVDDLEARERVPVGSESWAKATAEAFITLTQEACDEVAKPEWWNDEGLKVLSARAVRAAPDDLGANKMRAHVLRARCVTWEAGPRSAAELREAAVHYERAAALCTAPIGKAELSGEAEWCRDRAADMVLAARGW